MVTKTEVTVTTMHRHLTFVDHSFEDHVHGACSEHAHFAGGTHDAGVSLEVSTPVTDPLGWPEGVPWDATVKRMLALADELEAPLVCTKPGYGAPGHSHCAACCYGTGFVVTCDKDEAVLKAATALRDAVQITSASVGENLDENGGTT
jgi:hypothetical protein